MSIRHVNFQENLPNGAALGAIYAIGLNGFEISDDNFQDFTGSSPNGLQAGAGLTLDGGAGFTENGYIANNEFFNVKYPVTIRNLADGNLFIMNHAVCTTGHAVISGSIAFDLGYEWNAIGGSTGSTGGENTMFANQVEGCTIGYILDNQNDDNVISKAEMSGSMTGTSNSIGFSVLNSTNIWLDAQTLQYYTGIHVNGASSGVHLTNPRLLGANSSATITSDGGSFTSASDYVESGAVPTTTVLGLTASVTSNSTFLNDSLPKLTLNGSATCGPLDVTCFQVTQDFCTNAGTNAGSTGFSLTQIAGTSSVGLATPTANFPCGISVTTPATSGDGASFTLGTGNSLGPLGNTSANWTSYWIAAPSTTSTISVRWGFGTGGSSAAIPTNGIYLRYDTGLSDAAYMFCVDTSTTETCSNTGISPGAGTFVGLSITNVTAGEVSFSLYNSSGALIAGPATACASGCIISAAPPTANLTAFSSVVTNANSAEKLTLEKFALVESGLVR